MAQNKGKINTYSPEVKAIVDRILSGTDEEAELVLGRLKNYKPIPGLNMMTAYMIRRVIRNVATGSVVTCGNKFGISPIKGKWKTDDKDIPSISDYLEAAGINCDSSEGMKLVGCKPSGVRVNLYSQKEVLAILYAFKRSRERIDTKVREVYGLLPAEPEVAEPAPESAVDAVAFFTPEFIAEVIKAAVAATLKQK